MSGPCYLPQVQLKAYHHEQQLKTRNKLNPCVFSSHTVEIHKLTLLWFSAADYLKLILHLCE